MYLVTLDMCSCDVTPGLLGGVTKRELTGANGIANLY